MSRYSRRTGPAADFTFTSPATPVTGFTITRHFDDGELLVGFMGDIRNTAAAQRSPLIELQIDRAALLTQGYVVRIPAAAARQATILGMAKVSAGVHVLEVMPARDTDATQQLIANSAIFYVIQLPLWDSDADLL